MLHNEEKRRILKKFEEIERERTKDGKLIREIAQASVDKSEWLLSSIDPIAPVLRTALVINWREVAMKSRYERFRRMFPEIDSLAALSSVINKVPPLDFCKEYLNIESDKPEKNPKLSRLKLLTNGFLEYQASKNIPSEIEAMRDWAEAVDIDDLRNDPIGKLEGVGPGTVENIRLNLGYSTVKPDRHVIGVAQKILGISISISPCHYTELAEFIGVHPRRFDSALFEYGKLKGISA